MNNTYTTRDRYLDLFFGALTGLVAIYFFFGYALIALAVGISFLGTWLYFHKKRMLAHYAYEQAEFPKMIRSFRSVRLPHVRFTRTVYGRTIAVHSISSGR